MRGASFGSWVCVAALAMSGEARAGFEIGSGSAVDFGDAAIDFACGDLSIAGQASGGSATLTGIANFALSGGAFSAATAQLSLGGNFSNAGAFAAGSSSVAIVDACGGPTSQFAGATQFYDLSVVSAAAKQLVLPSSLAQGVAHALVLQGAAGNLLRVRSTSAGQRAQFAVVPAASQTIAYVDAADNQATLATIAPGEAALYNSVDSGNLINWFTNPSGGGGEPGDGGIPVPALDVGRWLLAAGLFLLAWLGLRGRRNST